MEYRFWFKCWHTNDIKKMPIVNLFLVWVEQKKDVTIFVISAFFCRSLKMFLYHHYEAYQHILKTCMMRGRNIFCFFSLHSNFGTKLFSFPSAQLLDVVKFIIKPTDADTFFIQLLQVERLHLHESTFAFSYLQNKYNYIWSRNRNALLVINLFYRRYLRLY